MLRCAALTVIRCTNPGAMPHSRRLSMRRSDRYIRNIRRNNLTGSDSVGSLATGQVHCHRVASRHRGLLGVEARHQDASQDRHPCLASPGLPTGLAPEWRARSGQRFCRSRLAAAREVVAPRAAPARARYIVRHSRRANPEPAVVVAVTRASPGPMVAVAVDSRRAVGMEDQGAGCQRQEEEARPELGQAMPRNRGHRAEPVVAVAWPDVRSARQARLPVIALARSLAVVST
jgi:hypothetical protein